MTGQRGPEQLWISYLGCVVNAHNGGRPRMLCALENEILVYCPKSSVVIEFSMQMGITQLAAIYAT